MIEEPRVNNMVMEGKVDIPRIFDDLLRLACVESPGFYFPSRVRIPLKTHPLYLFKSGKYIIYGCKSFREVEEVVQEFREFLMEVGIIIDD